VRHARRAVRLPDEEAGLSRRGSGIFQLAMSASYPTIQSLLLLLATASSSLPAQEYNQQRLDPLGIKFLVHKKLAAVPLMLGAEGPHLRARYQPEDQSDYVRGDYSWELYVLDFPKERPKDAGRDHALNFTDWAENKDVGRSERTWISKATPFEATDKQIPAVYYEYYDLDDRFGYWYRLAVVYTFDSREVALLANIPAIGKPKPSDSLHERARRMVSSLEQLTPEELAESAAGDPELDKYADSDARRAVLNKARQNIRNLQHWDYLTTPSFVVLYSWDPENPARRQDSQEFAVAMATRLQDFRTVYEELFPPHEQMAQAYPILRVCEDAQEFVQYGGEHSKDRVGWYNSATAELVIYHDRTHKHADEATIEATALHEAWHQYASMWFGPRVKLHPWFDEGTGEYFGAFVQKGKKWRYAVPRASHALLKAQVSRGTHTPLREFVEWTEDRFQGERAVDHYAQAYGLVDFLRRGPDRLGRKFDPAWQKILPTYTETVRKTRNRNRALKEAFAEVDWNAFEAAWLSWVKSKMK
jgi:hypothetical protein